MVRKCCGRSQGLLTRRPDPESKMGQHLLCRSEFHARVEYRSSLTVARRSRTGDPDIPQTKIICGASNGALFSLTPIDEAVGKRLQLLQGQLTRSVQHFAALNPKAQRCVMLLASDAFYILRAFFKDCPKRSHLEASEQRDTRWKYPSCVRGVAIDTTK